MLVFVASGSSLPRGAPPPWALTQRGGGAELRGAQEEAWGQAVPAASLPSSAQMGGKGQPMGDACPPARPPVQGLSRREVARLPQGKACPALPPKPRGPLPLPPQTTHPTTLSPRPPSERAA